MINFFNFFFGWIKAYFLTNKLSFSARISCGARLEGKVYSLGRVTISSKATIGMGTYINSGIIHSAVIGRYCSISYDVKIGLREHNHEFETTSPVLAKLKYGNAELANKIEKVAFIDDEVWIGSGVTILQGVAIGKGAVVGAGSVVCKNIPEMEIWGGVPAKKIKNRVILK